MLSLALRGVAARKLRAFLTAAAIFFGVAMVAGTLILTDTINNSFDNIFADANARTDVTVKPTETVEDSRGGEPPAFSADLLQNVLRVDGVARGGGLGLRLLDRDPRRRRKADRPHGPAAHRREHGARALLALDLSAGPAAAGSRRGGVRQHHGPGGEVRARRTRAGCGPGRGQGLPDRRHRRVRRRRPSSAARASRSSRSRRPSA